MYERLPRTNAERHKLTRKHCPKGLTRWHGGKCRWCSQCNRWIHPSRWAWRCVGKSRIDPASFNSMRPSPFVRHRKLKASYSGRINYGKVIV